jgi:nanoRNase/pAp phosphatase (c-di-AMP/oligoRNAs hydrolase)
MTQERLEMLLEACNGANKVLILPHNDPDPDAIASAVALQYLLTHRLRIESLIGYKGIVGRAENKALVRYLGRPMRRLVSADLDSFDAIALVDTQPGAGNNALPPDSPATIVLDHHPWREATATAAFADVRPEVGSSSAILAEYLQAAGLDPPRSLATALFYGIKTDTLGLARGASPADVTAYFSLQSQMDVAALIEIEQAQLPMEYFQRLDTALHAARIYDDVIISFLGPTPYPDLAAEMADFFLRLKGTRWVLCIGVYGEKLILAVRTRDRRGGAGELVRAIVGNQGTAGGHGSMAAGHVPLLGRDPEQLTLLFGQRALQFLRRSMENGGSPLTTSQAIEMPS